MRSGNIPDKPKPRPPATPFPNPPTQTPGQPGQQHCLNYIHNKIINNIFVHGRCINLRGHFHVNPALGHKLPGGFTLHSHHPPQQKNGADNMSAPLRGCLQTVKALEGRLFFGSSALNFLAINKLCPKNLPCRPKNYLVLGHSAGLKTTP